MSNPDVLKSCANCAYRNRREIPNALSEKDYDSDKRATAYLALTELFEPMGNGCHSYSNLPEKKEEMASLQKRIKNSLELEFDREMSYRDFIQKLQLWMKTLAETCTNFQQI